VQRANNCGVFKCVGINKLILVDIRGFSLGLLWRLTRYVKWVFTRQVQFKKSDGLQKLCLESGRMLTIELIEIASAVSDSFYQIFDHICFGCLLVLSMRNFVFLDEFLVLLV